MKVGDKVKLKPLNQCMLANEMGADYATWLRYSNNILVRVGRTVTDEQRIHFIKKHGDYPVNIQLPDRKNPNLFIGGAWVPAKWLTKKPSAVNKPYVEDKICTKE